MPYPQLRTGGPKSYSSQFFNSSNEAVSYPEGTTFASFPTPIGIVTTSVDENGVVTVTPNGESTGNVYINLYASVPGNTAQIAGTILVHIMDEPLSEKEFIQLTPEL
jgi:hypothetical protein